MQGGVHPSVPDTGLEGHDTTYMVLDKSGSMQTDDFQRLGGLIDLGIISGNVALGGYDDSAESLALVREGRPLTPEQASIILDQTGEAALDRNHAAAQAQQDGTSVDRDISKYADGRRDVSPELGNSSGLGMEEEGIASALAWIRSEAFVDEGERKQMIIVTDESDSSSMQDFEALQAEAKERNIRIKAVIFTSDGKDKHRKDGGDTTRFEIMDLTELEPHESWWESGKLDWTMVAAADQGSAEHEIGDFGLPAR